MAQCEAVLIESMRIDPLASLHPFESSTQYRHAEQYPLLHNI